MVLVRARQPLLTQMSCTVGGDRLRCRPRLSGFDAACPGFVMDMEWYGRAGLI
jgi:hypothetical protein